MGKAATLRPGDTLIFGDGSRTVTINAVEGGWVALYARGPDHVRVIRAKRESVDKDGEKCEPKDDSNR